MRSLKHNPTISKKKRQGKNVGVIEDGSLVRDMNTGAGLKRFSDENALLLPRLVDIPGGARLVFVGYHPNTQIMYFVASPEKGEEAKRAVADGAFRLFNLRRAGFAGRGTIDEFWNGKGAKALTQHLIGAVQFFTVGGPEDDEKYGFETNTDPKGLVEGDLVITHMAMKPAWQRLGLNTIMVRCVCADMPHTRLVFEDLTADGTNFALNFHDEPVYHFGRFTPSGGWQVHRVEEQKIYKVKDGRALDHRNNPGERETLENIFMSKLKAQAILQKHPGNPVVFDYDNRRLETERSALEAVAQTLSDKGIVPVKVLKRFIFLTEKARGKDVRQGDSLLLDEQRWVVERVVGRGTCDGYAARKVRFRVPGVKTLVTDWILDGETVTRITG